MSVWASYQTWHLTCESQQPITGQYSGHVIRADQSQASIRVTWSKLTNDRPVLWGVNWGVQGDKRKLSEGWGEPGKIVSERSTVGCHHLEIRSHEWDPFEEYFVMTIARTLWVHCYFENWASLRLTVIFRFRGVRNSIQSSKLLIKVPFPTQTIPICYRFYFLLFSISAGVLSLG